MARRQYNIHRAKTSLSRLVNETLSGDEVVIARNGEPMVRLVPYTRDDTPRRPGAWRGKVTIAPDFDELPPELERTFTGDSS
jgi:prevent-host-death family protein